MMIYIRSMKILEYGLWIIVALGLGLKLLHLPLSDLFVVIGTTLLAMLYFFLGWLLFPVKGAGKRMVALSIVSGVVLSIAITGLLFKIQIWPMGSLYLLISIPALALLLIVIQTQRGSRPELAPYFNGLTKRLLPAFFLAVMIYPVEQRTLLNFYNRDQPGKAELLDSMYRSHDPVVKDSLFQEIRRLEMAQPE